MGRVDKKKREKRNGKEKILKEQTINSQNVSRSGLKFPDIIAHERFAIAHRSHFVAIGLLLQQSGEVTILRVFAITEVV